MEQEKRKDNDREGLGYHNVNPSENTNQEGDFIPSLVPLKGQGQINHDFQEQGQDEFLDQAPGDMNDKELEHKWGNIKEDFRRKYSEITQKDTTYEKDGFRYMFGRLSRKLGKSDKELRKEIGTWHVTRT